MPQIPITIRSHDDRPLVKVVYEPVPQPAAGANAIFTVPQGYRLQIKSLFATIVTDANIPLRTLFFSLTGPSGILFYFEHPFGIGAAETRTICIAPGLSLVAHTATNMAATFPFPADLPLEEGIIGSLGLVGIQVGDQISAVNIMQLSQFVAE